MFFRMPRFIRRYLRNRMHPMAEHKAYDMKSRLSIIYAIIAWNAGGYVIYQIFSGNKNWPKTVGIRTDEEDIPRPAMAWAATLGVNKASVIRISSRGEISKKENFEVNLEPKTELTVLGELPESIKAMSSHS